MKCMMTKVQTSNSFTISGEPSRCLKSISGQVATPEQQIDLLGFWEVGTGNHIKFFILGDQAPRRKAYSSTRKQQKGETTWKGKKKSCLGVFIEHLLGMLSVQHVGQQYLELQLVTLVATFIKVRRAIPLNGLKNITNILVAWWLGAQYCWHVHNQYISLKHT